MVCRWACIVCVVVAVTTSLTVEGTPTQNAAAQQREQADFDTQTSLYADSSYNPLQVFFPARPLPALPTSGEFSVCLWNRLQSDISILGHGIQLMAMPQGELLWGQYANGYFHPYPSRAWICTADIGQSYGIDLSYAAVAKNVVTDQSTSGADKFEWLACSQLFGVDGCAKAKANSEKLRAAGEYMPVMTDHNVLKWNSKGITGKRLPVCDGTPKQSMKDAVKTAKGVPGASDPFWTKAHLATQSKAGCNAVNTPTIDFPLTGAMTSNTTATQTSGSTWGSGISFPFSGGGMMSAMDGQEANRIATVQRSGVWMDFHLTSLTIGNGFGDQASHVASSKARTVWDTSKTVGSFFDMSLVVTGIRNSAIPMHGSQRILSTRKGANVAKVFEVATYPLAVADDVQPTCMSPAVLSSDQYFVWPWSTTSTATTLWRSTAVTSWCREFNLKSKGISSFGWGKTTACFNSGEFAGMSMCSCKADSNIPQFSGPQCKTVLPANFNVFTDVKTCADAERYNICSGRGKCTRIDPTYGPICTCRKGWFGNAWFVAAWLNSINAAAPVSGPWTDPDHKFARRAHTAQCTMWEGQYAAYNWNTTGPDGRFDSRIVPSAPFICADTRTTLSSDLAPNTPPDTLYGGFNCVLCPKCAVVGTASCDQTTVGAVSGPVECKCKPNWSGTLCQHPVCPTGSHGRQCSAHGTCRPSVVSTFVPTTPFTPEGDPEMSWGTPYVGACNCNQGYGDKDGTCGKQICPLSKNASDGACGPHGTCIYSDCANYTKMVMAVATTAEKAACHAKCQCPNIFATCSLNNYALCNALYKYPSAALSACTFKCMDSFNCGQCTTECNNLRGLVPVTAGEWGTACNTGSCKCDPGWDKDAHGLCTLRACNSFNGRECNGQTISAGLQESGFSVCDHADPPVCQCWKSMGASEPRAIQSGNYNGPAKACGVNYTASGVCINPVGGQYCSGHGAGGFGGCYPPKCTGGGVTWGRCGTSADRNSAPVCHCDAVSHGQWCEKSVCGGSGANNPCSLGGTASGAVTGQCIPATPSVPAHCVCTVTAGGVAYLGTNCETAVPGCAPYAGGAGLCSSHGQCFNNGTGYSCDCHSGYTGVRCETDVPCGGLCPSHRGTCIGTTCQCFKSYRGATCEIDACAETGGTLVDKNTCNCSAVDGVQYPNANDDNTFRYRFRGCRKKCPVGSVADGPPFTGVECGGFNNGNYTRCSGAPVPANGGETASCICNNPSPNPITLQQVNWDHTEGGSCLPRCVHCFQNEGTLACDASRCGTSVCQYTGSSCNTRRCSSDATYTGATNGCQCSPPWLHPDPLNCSSVTHACVPAPYASAPSDVEKLVSQGCTCLFPFKRDTATKSTTYRLCISDCDGHGTASAATGSCVCNPGYGGPRCETELCAAGFSLAGASLGQVCNCRGLPQWKGPFCNESACIGGTPLPSNQSGCTCHPLFEGTHCETSKCHHGGTTPTDTFSGSTCTCKVGWFGDLCDRGRCGASWPDPVTNVSAIPLGYTCDCGPAGVFSTETGVCTARSCGTRGTLEVLDSAKRTCRCDDDWSTPTTGVWSPCSVHPCTDPLRHERADPHNASSPCVCKLKYRGTISPNDPLCAKIHTCAEWILRFPIVRVTIGTGVKWTPSTTVFPVQNPLALDNGDLSPCICNDTRYRMEFTSSQHFLGCALQCDMLTGFMNSSAIQLSADTCPCQDDVGHLARGGGTFCNGTHHAPSPRFPTPAPTPAPTQAGGSGAVSTDGWIIIGASAGSVLIGVIAWLIAVKVGCSCTSVATSKDPTTTTKGRYRHVPDI